MYIYSLAGIYLERLSSIIDLRLTRLRLSCTSTIKRSIASAVELPRAIYKVEIEAKI